MKKTKFKCVFCDKMIKIQDRRSHYRDHLDHNKKFPSKNPQAESIMGLREPKALTFSEPWEQGYECCVCHTKVVKKSKPNYLNEVTSLRWSEYWGFVYCPKCNLDIPSFFCLDEVASRRENIESKINMFLVMVHEIKQKAIKEYTNANKD